MEERRKIAEIKPWEAREEAWLSYLETKVEQLKVAKLDTTEWYRLVPKLEAGEVEAGIEHCIEGLESEIRERRGILSRFRVVTGKRT